jgi:hypothetical protein
VQWSCQHDRRSQTSPALPDVHRRDPFPCGLVGTPPRSCQIAEVWAGCPAGEGLTPRSRARPGHLWWATPRGSADSPRSGSLLRGEGPSRQCQIEAGADQVVGASMSTSVEPDLDASAARFHAERVESKQHESCRPGRLSDAEAVVAAAQAELAKEVKGTKTTIRLWTGAFRRGPTIIPCGLLPAVSRLVLWPDSSGFIDGVSRGSDRLGLGV